MDVPLIDLNHSSVILDGVRVLGELGQTVSPVVKSFDVAVLRGSVDLGQLDLLSVILDGFDEPL